MKIAVVGGGISGLTAAYLLARQHEITLFEACHQPGGHTYTVPVEEDGRTLHVDMGFIVFNDRTYPNFIRLLDKLGVASQDSEMSFSVRCEATGLEYNGSSLNQLFAQRRNLVRPSFYRMLLNILRFHRVAPELLTSAQGPTIGQFLEQHRFARPFVKHYLLPMTAAIWSTDPERIFDYPARTMASFLANHGMLSVKNRPQWRTIRGGSKTYVDAFAKVLGDRLRTGTLVKSIRRRQHHIEVQTDAGGQEQFDQVVIATHSDQALKLLVDADAAEKELLGAIPYQQNEAVLHTDKSLLPHRRRAWASWNSHINAPGAKGVQLTYYMNRLQNLDARRHYCVTLNRGDDIDPDKILHRVMFAHPLYTQQGIDAQARWDEIAGVRRTWYCGAYWGYGFHEDGVVSAKRVALALGVDG